MNFFNIKDFITYDFLTYSLMGTFILSMIFGLLSPLVIARKFSFMTSAISHSALLGPTISSLVFKVQDPLLFYCLSLLITLFSIIPLAYSSWSKKYLSNDSLIGVYLSATMAASLLLSSFYEEDGDTIFRFLFGDLVLINSEDLLITGIIAFCIALFIIINFKKWILTTYDPVGSSVLRLPLKQYHYIFFILITVLIVTSIKLAGSILITSFFIIPGQAGFILAGTRGIHYIFIYSILFSIITAVLGLVMANYYHLSPAPLMVIGQFLGLIFLKFIDQYDQIFKKYSPSSKKKYL